MSIERKSPFSKPATKTVETARFEVTAENVCPTCSKSMVKAEAAGHQVWVCDTDRHVFPVKDVQ